MPRPRGRVHSRSLPGRRNGRARRRPVRAVRARFLVDASGRDTFLAAGWRGRSATPSTAAPRCTATSAARAATRARAPATSPSYWFDHGWFWFIPLADGTTSVGSVVWPTYMKKRSVPVRRLFLATIQQCAPLAERLEAAELVTAVEATGTIRTSRTAATARTTPGRRCVRLRRPDVLLGRVACHEQRREARRSSTPASAIRRAPRRRSSASTARCGRARASFRGLSTGSRTAMSDLFMHPRNALRMKERDPVGAVRRHLRHDPDLGFAARLQRASTTSSRSQPATQASRRSAAHRGHRRGGPGE